jgi:hypothetical protein
VVACTQEVFFLSMIGLRVAVKKKALSPKTELAKLAP